MGVMRLADFDRPSSPALAGVVALLPELVLAGVHA